MRTPALLLVAIAAIGCAMSEPITDEDNLALRCAEAADVLRQCTGSAPAEFVDLCSADPSTDTFAAVDEILAADCPARTGKADQLDQLAFAGVCAPAVAAAALVTRVRNVFTPATELSADDAARLQAISPVPLSEVSLYFEARIIDEWDLGFTDVQFEFDVAAQTFGRRIYIDSPYRPGNRSQLRTLAHELAHTAQSESLGGVHPGFALAYCAAFYESDFSYYDNALEVQARKVADAFE